MNELDLKMCNKVQKGTEDFGRTRIYYIYICFKLTYEGYF